MSYDELVKQLRQGEDVFGPNELEYAAADAIVALQARVAELERANDQLFALGEKMYAELAAARALLRDCLPELDGEGVTIHRVWAALGKEPK